MIRFKLYHSKILLNIPEISYIDPTGPGPYNKTLYAKDVA